MKQGLFIFISLMVSGLMFSFLMDDDQRGKRELDNRITVERVLEATNLNFSKEIGQTSIIFQLAKEDSIKIECEDCKIRMGSPGDKGVIAMSLQSVEGVSKLNQSSFDRWIPVNSSNGKIGIVFERDGIGEKVLNIKNIRVLRKTRLPYLDVEGVPMGLLDVNNLYIDKLIKDVTDGQTTFFFKLKNEDKVLVSIVGANGSVPGNLVCNQYKQGEEFDKTPVATGALYTMPAVEGGQDRFAFEFSHLKDVKGINTYHIDIARIPAHSSGFKQPVPIPPDTMETPVDTPATGEVPEDPFLKYLEKIGGGPNFQCKTPEMAISANIMGRLNLGLTKRNKQCFDLPLSDECVASGECIGCDTLWAFWLGAGHEMINRYKFADSTRKLASGEGLIEAFARSKKYRGMQSNGVFPDPSLGEDVFFVVVDQYEKDRFLNQDWTEFDWTGDGIFSYTPGGYINSGQYMLRYDPARPMSLCVCNNNSVTTVPVLFRFQQFLTDPNPADTVKPVGVGAYDESLQYSPGP